LLTGQLACYSAAAFLVKLRLFSWMDNPYYFSHRLLHGLIEALF
jgi:hypothetical protein